MHLQNMHLQKMHLDIITFRGAENRLKNRTVRIPAILRKKSKHSVKNNVNYLGR